MRPQEELLEAGVRLLAVLVLYVGWHGEAVDERDGRRWPDVVRRILPESIQATFDGRAPGRLGF